MSISILDIVKQLLDMDKILYLPKTKIIKDEDLFDTYFNLIDHKTLFKLLEEEDLLESDITINLYNIFNTEDVLISDMDIDKYNNIQIDDNINKIQKGKIYDNNDISGWLNCNKYITMMGVNNYNKKINNTGILDIHNSTILKKYCYLPNGSNGIIYLRCGIKEKDIRIKYIKITDGFN